MIQEINKEQLKQITFYARNEMKELKRICNPIIYRKKLPQMYYDDLYSDAMNVLMESVKSFNNEKQISFESFLKGNISKSFWEWSRNNMRLKRCNVQYDINGKPLKDEEGNIIILQNTSIDAPSEDSFAIEERISSNFEIEKEINKNILEFDENILEYLNSLGFIEKKIAKMIMDGYESREIKQILKLSDKEYRTFISDMKSYEKRKILKNNHITTKYKIKKEEQKMEVAQTMTAEKTKPTSYSLETISKKLRKHRLRDDHVLQRHSGQWSSIARSELISDVLQGRALTEIIISEEPKNGVIMYWLIDGKQRCTTVDDFLNNGFAISKKVQVSDIIYQSDKTDENGKIIYNADGFPIPETQVFDIRGKRFSQLPEELQDKFKEYQIRVMLNLNCNKKDIAYDIARFNRCRPMNVAQNGWTGLDEVFAEYIDNILKMDFFKPDYPKTFYTTTNNKNGSMRRMLVESIMILNYLDFFDKDFRKMCEYLSENSSENLFINFYAMIEHLSLCINRDASCVFNTKNSPVWFCLFKEFLKLDLPDYCFGEFVSEFVKKLHKKEVNGINYDSLDKEGHSKNKNVIKNKLSLLKNLMFQYFSIEKEENNVNVIDFVRENVNSDITENDIQDYEEDLETITLNVNNNSKLLEDENHNSLIALIAYCYKKDINYDKWFISYFEKVNTYKRNQKENYIDMKESLQKFLKM